MTSRWACVLVVAMGCGGRVQDEAPIQAAPPVLIPPDESPRDPRACPDGHLVMTPLGAGAVTPLRDGRAAAFAGGLLVVLEGEAVRRIASAPIAGRLISLTPQEQLLQLADGRLLLVGGSTGGMASWGVAETWRFDLASTRWIVSASLPEGRFRVAAVPLREGGALVVGGRSLFFKSSMVETVLPNAARYDSLLDVWTPTGPLTRLRMDPLVVLLDDGRVLVAGGRDANDPKQQWQDAAVLADAEVYDPARNGFAAIRPMLHPRESLAAARLPDGRIFVASGDERTTEIFDPRTGDWSDGPELPGVGSVATAPLSCGEVIVVLADASPTARVGRIDLATGRWKPIALPPSMKITWSLPRAFALNEDSVLVQAGGSTLRYVSH